MPSQTRWLLTHLTKIKLKEPIMNLLAEAEHILETNSCILKLKTNHINFIYWLHLSEYICSFKMHVHNNIDMSTYK